MLEVDARKSLVNGLQRGCVVLSVGFGLSGSSGFDAPYSPIGKSESSAVGPMRAEPKGLMHEADFNQHKTRHLGRPLHELNSS